MFAFISPIAYAKPFVLTMVVFSFILFAVLKLLHKHIANNILKGYAFVDSENTLDNPFSHAYNYIKSFLIGFVPAIVVVSMLIRPREMGLCLLAVATIPLVAFMLIEVVGDYTRLEKLSKAESSSNDTEKKESLKEQMQRIYQKSKGRWFLAWVSVSASIAIGLYALTTL